MAKGPRRKTTRQRIDARPPVGRTRAAATRTINPLHFEDLEPHRFEDLIRQLAYGFRTWRYLDATGRLGADGGLDIRGTEVLYANADADQDDESSEDGEQQLIAADEREWRIECKRYQRIGPSVIRQVVAEVIPEGSEPPYGVIVAAACDLSAQAMTAFRGEAFNRGAREAHVWGKAALEDMLFQPQWDHLLFAYFGISLGSPRQLSRLKEVRAKITVRNKLVRALEVQDLRAPVSTPVLMRDINDGTYPREPEPTEAGECRPWHLAMIDDFAVGGVWVWLFGYDGWLKPDGTWDIILESRDAPAGAAASGLLLHEDESPAHQRRRDLAAALTEMVPEDERRYVRESWGLPYDRILEVDRLGDGLYGLPQLYLRFDGEYGPYGFGPVYITAEERFRRGEKVLEPENRRPLFDALRKKLKRRG